MRRPVAEIQRLIKPFDMLRIPKLPDGIAIDGLLAAPAPVMMESSSYSVALNAPFEQWRASALDRSYQKELAKKLRQLQKKGALSFACCEDDPGDRSPRLR